jgi:hypothetical protein
MKRQLIMVGLLLAVASPMASAQFNTDALKKMQQEGHRLLEEAQEEEGPAVGAPRRYTIGDNLCLTAAQPLAIRRCRTEPAQRWIMDEAGHLLSADERCLAGAQLAQCNNSNVHLWQHDDRDRLANKAGQCLQLQGGLPASDSKRVIVARCSEAQAQVWAVEAIATASGGAGSAAASAPGQPGGAP